MNYEQSLDYLERLEQVAVPHFLKPEIGLRRMQALLNLQGNPERKLTAINIVGTSGKGSVSKMLAASLSASEFRVGAYYSPHLIDLRERIEINTHWISEKDFARLLSKLRPLVEKLVDSPWGMPSYHEVLTALAIQYFAEQRCDYVVMEAGMGGSFDASSILPRQKLVLITAIGLDHTEFLGKTVTRIARDKAGVVKRGSLVLSSKQVPAVQQVLREVAAQRHAQIAFIKDPIKKLKVTDFGTGFGWQGSTYELALLGKHQAENAVLVIEAAKKLKLNKDIVQKTLKKLTLSGRMQFISRKPRIVVDVAHNPQKMAALAKTLKEIGYRKLYLVFGMMADKDVAGSLKQILPLVTEVCFTLPHTTGRKVASFSLYSSLIRRSGVKYRLCSDPVEAVEIYKKRLAADDILCITGSFTTVSEILKMKHV